MSPPPLAVRSSPIAGFGGFATRAIAAGETVCRAPGEEVSLVEVVGRLRAGRMRESDPLQIGRATYLDLAPPAVYLNHACAPNAWLDLSERVPRVVALDGIAAGEEITFDYSAVTWEDGPAIAELVPEADAWCLLCSCGRAGCRQSVDQFYTLPAAQQADLLARGIAPAFIVENVGRALEPRARRFAELDDRRRRLLVLAGNPALTGETLLAAVRRRFPREGPIELLAELLAALPLDAPELARIRAAVARGAP